MKVDDEADDLSVLILGVLAHPHAPVPVVTGLVDGLVELANSIDWTLNREVLRALLAEAMRRELRTKENAERGEAN